MINWFEDPILYLGILLSLDHLLSNFKLFKENSKDFSNFDVVSLLAASDKCTKVVDVVHHVRSLVLILVFIRDLLGLINEFIELLDFFVDCREEIVNFEELEWFFKVLDYWDLNNLVFEDWAVLLCWLGELLCHGVQVFSLFSDPFFESVVHDLMKGRLKIPATRVVLHLEDALFQLLNWKHSILIHRWKLFLTNTIKWIDYDEIVNEFVEELFALTVFL